VWARRRHVGFLWETLCPVEPGLEICRLDLQGCRKTLLFRKLVVDANIRGTSSGTLSVAAEMSSKIELGLLLEDAGQVFEQILRSFYVCLQDGPK
jgi:hypothetical protein